MPEIEAIKAKSFDETTMAEAIVLYLAGDKTEKKEALNRIDFLNKKKNNKEPKKGLILSK